MQVGFCPYRASTTRQRRINARPHEPETQVEQEPIATIPAGVEGRELGADSEEQIAKEDRLTRSSGGASSSRDGAAVPASAGNGASSFGDGAVVPADSGGGASSRDSGGQEPEAVRSGRGRGPDQEQRHRRTYRDQGDNPENPHDWSNFDSGRVIRIF